MAMIVITTRSSIRVKPRREWIIMAGWLPRYRFARRREREIQPAALSSLDQGSTRLYLKNGMPDPEDPSSSAAASAADPTPPPVTTPESPNLKSSSTGLPSNIAAALACFPLIGGIIFYLLEKEDRFVRFYAMQSIIFGGVWVLFEIVSNIIEAIFYQMPVIGGFMGVLWHLACLFIHVAFVVIMIIAIIKAFTNVRWDIPYVGPIARKQVGEVKA
jgi:uncharacterized membrane protein